LMPRIASRIGRVQPQRRARAFVDAAPGGMRHLLPRSSWDADAVGDDLRAHVEHLGEPQAALVVDETEDVNKGTATAGGI
jgi:SRSO17 transposase